MDETRRRRSLWPALVIIVLILWWLGVEWAITPDPSGPDLPVPPTPSPSSADDARREDESQSVSVDAAPTATDGHVVLVGRVREEGSDAPLGRFELAVSSGSSSATAESAEDGTFDVSWPRGLAATIEVLPRPGWSRLPPPRPLRPDELAGEVEILLRVAPDPSTPVRGRIVDENGDGLRSMSLLLHMAAIPDAIELRSDARGDFASPTALRSGALALEVWDETPEGRVDYGLRYVEHDAEVDAAREHVITVKAGPSFVVDLRTAATESQGWRARVVERGGDVDDAGTLVRMRSGDGDTWAIATANGTEERAWTWLELRGLDDGLPWIRYAALEHAPRPDLRPWLEVADASDTSRGEGALESTVGVHAAPVVVEARPVGTLRGTVRDAGGAPVPDAHLWLAGHGTSATAGPWRTDADGSFAVPGLRPGAYELTVASRLRAGLTLDVTVDAGENALRPLVLSREDSAHAIRGGFVCDYDHGAGTVLLDVRSTSGRSVARTVVRRVASSRAVDAVAGRFLIEDLPGGSYLLQPIEIHGEHHWTPDEVRVTTPVPTVAFRCRGRVPHDRVSVAASDEESGTPVSGVEVLLGPVRQEPFTWPESRPRGRGYTWPRHSPLPWTVWAPGYQPQSGDRDDVTRGGPGPELRVDLRRGFGARLLLRESPREDALRAELDALGNIDGPPVPGVRVTTDKGTAVGVTDERGELLVRLDDQPDALRLHHPRWRAVAVDDRDPSPVHLPVIVVWMAVRP